MSTTDPRLGALDRLTVEILKDFLLSLDDKWLDDFEELAHDQMNPSDSDVESEEFMDRWDDLVEKLQDKVIKRVAGAITHYATGMDDRLINEMNRQLGAEDEKPPHTILVNTPAAHLVRQV